MAMYFDRSPGAVLAAALALLFALAAGDAWAAVSELEPESGGVATMAAPGDHWFVMTGFMGGGSIFDGDTGRMQGRVRVSDYTSGVVLDRERGRIYVPATYYSRGSYGERTDLLVVNDMETLAPIAEIQVPNKLAAVFHRAVIGPVGERFMGLYNMTPAMSVSIVDLEDERFVGEISTAGCALVYPLSGRRFMQICGDGTVQVIGLDARGREASRKRSRPFFSVDDDPVFDLALPGPDGWLLVSFEGRVFEVTVTDEVSVSSPWSLLSEEDAAEGWRVGGNQPFAYNARTGLLFAIMHQGGRDTHEDPGPEIWAFNTATRQRGYRLALEQPASAVEVSRDPEPLLFVGSGFPLTVDVHDARTGRWLRRVTETGLTTSKIQAF